MNIAGRLALAALLIIAPAAGCAVAPDDAPRDIDPGALEVPEQDTGSSGGQAAAGTGRIYLLAPDVPGEPTRLQPVARDLNEDVDAVMDALLAGPNNAEFIDRYRTNLPAGMTVLGLGRQSRGVIHLDVDETIATLRGDELILALAQIVYTLNDVDGVNGVTLTVEGVAAQWPAGNGELQSDTLTVYDFPGLEPSTQPAYPAVPSED